MKSVQRPNLYYRSILVMTATIASLTSTGSLGNPVLHDQRHVVLLQTGLRTSFEYFMTMTNWKVVSKEI